MVAAVMPGLSVSLDPWMAALSIALLGGVYVLSHAPAKLQRVTIALGVASMVGVGLARQSAYPPVNCCDWIDLLWICLAWC